jgi:hypothetical protein
VIVILENKSAQQIEGNKDAPYLNALAQSGAYMAQAHFARTPYGIVPRGASSHLPARPSQPNYLYLFSGNNQGVLPNWFHADDSPYRGTATYDRHGNVLDRPLPHTSVGIGNSQIPADMRPFMTPNLGAAIINVGGTFGSFSESLPYPHFDDTFDPGGNAKDPDLYHRKHNPAVNWINMAGKRLPADKARFVLPISANLGFTSTHDPVDGKDYRGFTMDAKGNPMVTSSCRPSQLLCRTSSTMRTATRLPPQTPGSRLTSNPTRIGPGPITASFIVTFDEDAATDASRGDPGRTDTTRSLPCSTVQATE